jgi:hypothetical protein
MAPRDTDSASRLAPQWLLSTYVALRRGAEARVGCSRAGEQGFERLPAGCDGSVDARALDLRGTSRGRTLDFGAPHVPPVLAGATQPFGGTIQHLVLC